MKDLNPIHRHNCIEQKLSEIEEKVRIVKSLKGLSNRLSIFMNSGSEDIFYENSNYDGTNSKVLINLFYLEKKDPILSKLYHDGYLQISSVKGFTTGVESHFLRRNLKSEELLNSNFYSFLSYFIKN